MWATFASDSHALYCWPSCQNLNTNPARLSQILHGYHLVWQLCRTQHHRGAVQAAGGCQLWCIQGCCISATSLCWAAEQAEGAGCTWGADPRANPHHPQGRQAAVGLWKDLCWVQQGWPANRLGDLLRWHWLHIQLGHQAASPGIHLLSIVRLNFTWHFVLQLLLLDLYMSIVSYLSSEPWCHPSLYGGDCIMWQVTHHGKHWNYFILIYIAYLLQLMNHEASLTCLSLLANIRSWLTLLTCRSHSWLIEPHSQSLLVCRSHILNLYSESMLNYGHRVSACTEIAFSMTGHLFGLPGSTRIWGCIKDSRADWAERIPQWQASGCWSCWWTICLGWWRYPIQICRCSASQGMTSIIAHPPIFLCKVSIAEHHPRFYYLVMSAENSALATMYASICVTFSLLPDALCLRSLNVLLVFVHLCTSLQYVQAVPRLR